MAFRNVGAQLRTVKTPPAKLVTPREGQAAAATRKALAHALKSLATVNKLRPPYTPSTVKIGHDKQLVGRTLELLPEGIVANTGKKTNGEDWFDTATKIGVYEHPTGLRIEAFARGLWRPVEKATNLKVDSDYEGFYTKSELQKNLRSSIVELMNQSRDGVGDKPIWQPYPNAKRAGQLLVKATKKHL